MENEEGYEAIVRGFRAELDQAAGYLANNVWSDMLYVVHCTVMYPSVP